ncbi:MAG: hypothetical protein WCH34_11315 [Bacteroidota bacterium]
MNQEKTVVRLYNFSDGILGDKAKQTVRHIDRDFTFFQQRGVTTLRINAFNANIIAFANMPSDPELKGEVTIATELKDKFAEQLRTQIRGIRMIVENTFGLKHSSYRMYKFDQMYNTSDEKLHRLARTVVKLATIQLPKLAAEGLTQTMINNLKSVDEDFDSAIDDQILAIRKRDIQTVERIETGNLIYREMRKLCNIGKDLFANVNSALYNTYLIYNTPSGKAPKKGTFGSMSGVVTSSKTQKPIEGVQIHYSKTEKPIITDKAGEYSNDVVKLKCTTFTATHPDFKDFKGSFSILPDAEIVYDFIMEPKD